MDIARFEELSGLRDEDLTDDERRFRSEALTASPDAQRMLEQDRAVLALFETFPDLDSELTGAEVLARAAAQDGRRAVAQDGSSTTLVTQAVDPANAPAANSPWWRHPAVAPLAAAAGLALGLLLGPGLQQDVPEQPEVGLRSMVDAAELPEVWLHVNARTSADSAERAEDGGIFGQEQRFFVEVQTGRRGGHLTLVELLPSGESRVLYGEDGSWLVDDEAHAWLTGEEERLLAYSLDEIGATTVLAVLHDGTVAFDEDTLLSLRNGSGERLPGVLAVDGHTLRRTE